MSIQEKNYWLETLKPALPPRDLELPPAVDVAIVGGGITGLSAALALAKRGIRVVVLEAETCGWGASSRNGGMVLTGLKLPLHTLLRRYGRQAVQEMYAASIETIDCVEQVVSDEGIDCNFSRCGHLEVAVKAAHFDAYRESAALLKRDFNHEVQIVSKSELHAEIGSNAYHGGLVDAKSAGLNPARYVAGLAVAARRAGVCVCEHSRVTRIDQRSNSRSAKFHVSTSRGAITAREVLLASGAYTTDATPALRQKIITIGSFIIVTKQLPDTLAREVSPRNRMIFDSKHFLYYYRLTPDDRMLFGGRAAFFPANEQTIRKSAEILRRGMISVYPQLRDVEVEFVWGGTLDFVFDVMPHSGTIDDMRFAVGYAGHGVAAATWFGKKLAGVLCGDANTIPFERINFPNAPIGLRSGNSWALPLAGAYYKMLDWLT